MNQLAMKRSKRRHTLLFSLGVFGLIGLFFYPNILRWYAYQFRVDDPVRRSDAIVILLGKVDDRSSKAAELYGKGVAPLILMGPTLESSGEADYHRRILVRGGVPAEAIRQLPGAAVRNTQDEALRLRDYLQTHPLRRITVVTTSFHTARTQWAFRKALRGIGVEIRMVASRQEINEDNWYEHEIGYKIYVLETIKNIYYRFAY